MLDAGLRSPGRFEAFHDALASPGGLMIDRALVMPVFHREDHAPPGGCVTCRFVHDQHARSDTFLVEQLLQQTLGRLRVTAALNQDIEHHSMLVDRTPKPVLPARNAEAAAYMMMNRNKRGFVLTPTLG